MSGSGNRVTARVLPRELVALLDGRDLDSKVGLTVQLMTVDADGWPRVALLSVGELVALGPRGLRMALWSSSKTTENLTRSGIGTLAMVYEGSAHSVTIEAVRAADLAGSTPLAVFDARVQEHRSDRVSYAVLTHGIGFDLEDADASLARWRTTVDSLIDRGAVA